MFIAAESKYVLLFIAGKFLPVPLLCLARSSLSNVQAFSTFWSTVEEGLQANWPSNTSETQDPWLSAKSPFPALPHQKCILSNGDKLLSEWQWISQLVTTAGFLSPSFMSPIESALCTAMALGGVGARGTQQSSWSIPKKARTC